MHAPQLSRHESWRLMYRQRRYLQDATQEELGQRLRDVLSNLTVLSDVGKITGVPIAAGGGYWIELFTHVVEEYRLRRTPIPPGAASGASLPKPTWPAEPRATNVLRNLHSRLGTARYLVKYGKSKFLKPALEHAEWRISPASSYSDSSLNAAQRDSELALTVHALPAEVRVQVWDGTSGRAKGEIPTLGYVNLKSFSVTDYYVSCVARELSLRLFDDFEADACLVIREPSEFARRIFASARQALAGWAGLFRDVAYIDPYNSPVGKPDIFVAKHFRYWYQQESRFVWLPPVATNRLDHVLLELGKIDDICEFFQL